MWTTLALLALGCAAPPESDGDGCTATVEPVTEEAPAVEDILPVLLAYSPVEVWWHRAASGDASSPVALVTRRDHPSTRQVRLEGPRCQVVGVARLFPVELDINIGEGQARGVVDVVFAAFTPAPSDIYTTEGFRAPAELSAEWLEATASQRDFHDGERPGSRCASCPSPASRPR